MRVLLLLFMMITCLAALSQAIPQNPNKIENGLRQGKWTIGFDNDWNPTSNKDSIAFYRVIEYKDDKPIGTVTDFYLNGNPQMQGHLLTDRPTDQFDGKVIYYYPSGKKEKEENYDKGELSVDVMLYKEDGSIDSVALADHYYDESLYGKAEPLLLQVRKSMERKVGKLNPDYALACIKLGFLYRSTNIYSNAETYYLEAREIYEKLYGKQSADYARASGSLGELYFVQGLYAKAEPLQVESKDIFEKTKGKFSSQYATSCINLANQYVDQGRFVEAESLLIEAKEIREKIDGKVSHGYARTCNNLGVLYGMQGLHAKSIPLYLEAKNVREILKPFSSEYANTCTSLGVAYLNSGLYAEAEPLLLQAKELALKLFGKDHSSYASTSNNLSTLYLRQGFYAKAESLQLEAYQAFEKTLGVHHQLYARSCHNLANIYECLKQYEKAEIFYLKEYQTYFSIIENQFSNLSEKEKEAFLKTFKNNFEFFNSFVLLRKEQNPAIVSNMYNNLLVTKALLFNAQNKMRNNILNSGNPSLIETFKKWQTKRDYLAKVYKMTIDERQKRNSNVQQLETEANQLEKQLSSQSEVFAQVNDKKRYTWQDVQKTLKPKEAAIEMVRFRYFNKKFTDTVFYAALIITPKSKLPELVVFKNGNDLEKGIAYYKNSIKFELEDKKSYDLFWKPIENSIKAIAPKTTKVYFSADGVYHSLNLQTLLNPQTGKYVADQWDLQLVTNTKDLTAKKQEANSKDEALLFGYPDYGHKSTRDSTQSLDTSNYNPVPDSLRREFSNSRISMLPGTEKEVNELYATLQKQNWRTQSYLLGQATENKLKALQSPKVLHIATHGFFMQDVSGDNGQRGLIGFDNQKVFENPLLRSGLLLAGSQQTFDGKINADEEDGILTAYEAMNLNLDRTELVVLSACETGLGEIKNGEGVFGLQRAFQTAGAKSIIMSLWKVDDTSTQELMQLFYSKWLATGNKRLAFLQTQEAMKAKYKHPYYWGAFVMVGD